MTNLCLINQQKKAHLYKAALGIAAHTPHVKFYTLAKGGVYIDNP